MPQTCTLVLLIASASLQDCASAHECQGAECEAAGTFFLQHALDVGAASLLQHAAEKKGPRDGLVSDFFAALADMRARPYNATVQSQGCSKLYVDSSSKEMQDAAAKTGVIDVIAAAQANHPDSREVQVVCTTAMITHILFNRDNGLYAGRLGALNHTLAAFKRWMDDPIPTVSLLGGAIGGYFDYVDENRLIARELGGIRDIIQNIWNNYHGKLGDWNVEPVKQSLYALSSGTKFNEDICVEMRCLELYAGLMLEHGHEPKIAEEAMQSLRFLLSTRNPHGEEDRRKFIEAGGPAAVSHVMQVSSLDQGAVDLACITVSYMIGPHNMDGNGELPFDQGIQSKLTEAGLVQTTLGAVMGGQGLQQIDHGGFNFDTDAMYNYKRDCFDALGDLAYDHASNKAVMLAAGLHTHVLERLAEPPKDPLEIIAGCKLLSALGVPGSQACSTLGHVKKLLSR